MPRKWKWMARVERIGLMSFGENMPTMRLLTPMAAMALALGVRLQKPRVYELNASGRTPKPIDAELAQKTASKVVIALVTLALPAMFFIAFVGGNLLP